MDKEKVFIVSNDCGEDYHIFPSERAAKDWIYRNIVNHLIDIYGELIDRYSTDDILHLIQKDFYHLEKHGYIEGLWYINEGVIED